MGKSNFLKCYILIRYFVLSAYSKFKA